MATNDGRKPGPTFEIITPTVVRRELARVGLGAQPGKITEFAVVNGMRDRLIGWSERASASVRPHYQAEGDPDAQGKDLARLLSVLPGWVLDLCDQLEQARGELATVKPKPVEVFREGGCVRLDDRGLWLLNQQTKGWSSYGVLLKDWDQLFRIYNVRIGAPQQDEAGVYWPVEAGPQAQV